MSAKPAPARTDARARLAEAIERKHFAERELSAAQDARSAASRRHYEATEKLEMHRAAAAKVASDDDLGRSFIEARAAGDDCDVATLTRAGADRETELRNEIDVWRKTRDACAKVVTDREADLQSAAYRVDAAAHAVVSEAFRPALIVEARRLMTQLEDLRAELISIDLGCDGLSRSEAQKSAVLSVRCMRLENDGSAETRRRWESFFKALKADADEPFPLIKLEA